MDSTGIIVIIGIIIFFAIVIYCSKSNDTQETNQNVTNESNKEETMEKKKLDGEYIYAKVVFGSDPREYWFIADQEVNEGDVVGVLVGKYLEKRNATIKEVKVCNKNNAPYPVTSTKHITQYKPFN